MFMPRRIPPTLAAKPTFFGSSFPADGILSIAFLLIYAMGCSPKEATPTPPSPAITVFVAASTKDAVEEVAAIFRKETGIDVKISPGSSNALAAQIAEGAPADLFLSASEEWADSLKTKGLTLESRKLLGNRLVLVVPRGNAAGVKVAKDLRGDTVKKIALAGEKVPAGKYAEQTLKALGLYGALAGEKKIVRGQDVRVTLGYVERGEVEAGIVYATDANISKDVVAVYSFDAKKHDPIVYPLVLLKSAEKNESARKLYAFLSSRGARAIFERLGFTVLE